tara:strand:- start:430 stop:870 length:441 start_codon:yes stop_codon:yes gene_type:complete
MLNNKKMLFSTPLIFIGIIMIFMGIRWMIVDQPWMLDKIANEERLGISFDKLFEPSINNTLPGYLRQIYRFFGLWVIIIGLFIVSFSRPSIIEYKNIRFTLLFCTGIMLCSGLILAYILIPSSPFIYLGWFLLLMYFVSAWNYRSF